VNADVIEERRRRRSGCLNDERKRGKRRSIEPQHTHTHTHSSLISNAPLPTPSLSAPPRSIVQRGRAIRAILIRTTHAPHTPPEVPSLPFTSTRRRQYNRVGGWEGEERSEGQRSSEKPLLLARIQDRPLKRDPHASCRFIWHIETQIDAHSFAQCT
jgi:hypothetical protein